MWSEYFHNCRADLWELMIASCKKARIHVRILVRISHEIVDNSLKVTKNIRSNFGSEKI